MKRRQSFKLRGDFSLITTVLLLLAFWVVAVYIAVSNDYPDLVWSILGQQVAWIVLGCMISFVVMLFNTEFFMESNALLVCLWLGLNGLAPLFLQPKPGCFDRF